MKAMIGMRRRTSEKNSIEAKMSDHRPVLPESSVASETGRTEFRLTPLDRDAAVVCASEGECGFGFFLLFRTPPLVLFDMGLFYFICFLVLFVSSSTCVVKSSVPRLVVNEIMESKDAQLHTQSQIILPSILAMEKFLAFVGGSFGFFHNSLVIRQLPPDHLSHIISALGWIRHGHALVEKQPPSMDICVEDHDHGAFGSRCRPQPCMSCPWCQRSILGHHDVIL